MKVLSIWKLPGKTQDFWKVRFGPAQNQPITLCFFRSEDTFAVQSEDIGISLTLSLIVCLSACLTDTWTVE